MGAHSTWCGLCNEYTDHDSAHHAGPYVGGDKAVITYEGKEYVARVEEVRGARARVAFSLNRGRTHTCWVDLTSIERV